MKIKTNVRAGSGGASGSGQNGSGSGGVGGSSSKSANSVVTYISPLAAQYVNRCTGV
jgi:hypothetical protein